MKSPAEILLGKPAADWRAKDRWLLALLAGALAAGLWVVLVLCLGILQPRHRWPFAFTGTVAVLDGAVVALLAFFRFPKGNRAEIHIPWRQGWDRIVTLVRRKQPPPLPPEAPGDR